MIYPDHPLQFSPILRSYLWGGERLASQLGKKPPENGVWAESWELVDHREAESVVSEGLFKGKTLRNLIESHSPEIMGYEAPNDRFPLLLKYLDCQRVLSVQVHPDDAYGATMPVPDRGKTEAWYVIDSEPGAKIYAGLRPGIDREQLARAIQSGTTESCLHVLEPKPGDCIFIPAGTVHALGAGLLVAEIQQASDCTFRLFDWNRVDQDGNPRALHIEQALEVIDFQSGPTSAIDRQSTPIDSEGWRTLVDCDKFRLRESAFDSWKGELTVDETGPVILTIPIGSAKLIWGSQSMDLPRASTVLIPSACPPCSLQLSSGGVALACHLPTS